MKTSIFFRLASRPKGRGEDKQPAAKKPFSTFLLPNQRPFRDDIASFNFTSPLCIIRYRYVMQQTTLHHTTLHPFFACILLYLYKYMCTSRLYAFRTTWRLLGLSLSSSGYKGAQHTHTHVFSRPTLALLPSTHSLLPSPYHWSCPSQISLLCARLPLPLHSHSWSLGQEGELVE